MLAAESLEAALRRLEGHRAVTELFDRLAHAAENEILVIHDAHEFARALLRRRLVRGEHVFEALRASEVDRKRGALGRGALHGYRAPVRPHDAVHHGEPEPRALADALRGEERVEDPFLG